MSNNNRGFGLIELIVAVGLFLIIATSGIGSIVNSLVINRLADNQTRATLWAKEGIEAARSIRNQAFAGLTAGPHGIASNSGVWTFSGFNNTDGIYTRVVNVATVYRDGSGNINDTTGTPDDNTVKVTSTVNWSFAPSRNLLVSLSEYLTNFRRQIAGDWSLPSLQGTYNANGNQNAVSVTYLNNYIFMGRNNGTPDFLIIDGTNPATPSLSGSLSLGDSVNNIYVQGNYAYAATNINAGELVIIDVSNKNTPVVASSFNASGNANGSGVWVEGNFAYLIRDAGPNEELMVINVSNPLAPTLSGSLQLLGDLGGVYKRNQYLFLVSADNNSEVQVIDVSSSASPLLVANLNLAGVSNATSIAGAGNYIYVGRADGSMEIADVSNPISPSATGVYAGAGGNTNGVSVSPDGNLAFMATSDPGAQFKVVQTTNKAAPNLLSSLNIGDETNSLIYNFNQDRVYVATSDNATELAIIQPQ